MADIILKVENISKQYRLGNVGTGTLKDDFKRWTYKVRGKEDPFLKIGEANDRSSAGISDYVWALRDINFEVQRGEVLGVIGKNGAGKSTLLKLLSRVTSPTTGTIKSKGRIASLLEVGTGFHPEMTGRENIYLNGAILGMTKVEIKGKEDEIIKFSGCERYIDTPVKRYSSGMRVRLAFAVAAHLEPDILIIDEVLAVGDVEFQKKAIGKMQDISRGEGRTVLFVSHNMAAVKNLCNRSIVLEEGMCVFVGKTEASIDFYLNSDSIGDNEGELDFHDLFSKDRELKLLSASTSDISNRVRSTFLQSEAIKIGIVFQINEYLTGVRFNLTVKSLSGIVAFVTSSHELTKVGLQRGKYRLELVLPAYLLNNIGYKLTLNVGIPGIKILIAPLDFLHINVEGEFAGGSKFVEKWPGLVSPKLEWKIDEHNNR